MKRIEDFFNTPRYDSSDQIIPLGENGELTAIDLFCGAGGVSEGMHNTGFVKVVAAVNHSPEAISAHKKNNPDVLHFQEDIQDYENILLFLPSKVNILWASAECTNHSNAKGGQSRDADSRSLPEYLDKYVIRTNPDYFIIENVKEFTEWGPLTEKRDKKGNICYEKKKGKFKLDDDGNKIPIMVPIKERKGELYKEWVDNIRDLGYSYMETFLNAADFGAHTSRVRYFGIFYRTWLDAFEPMPTHSKDGSDGLPKWKACKEKIDLEDEGNSIFGRRQLLKRAPLVPNTLKRIAYGIRKYHMDDEFIAKYYGTSMATSVRDPLHTITTKDRHALIQVERAHFIGKQQGQLPGKPPTNAVSSVMEPLHTIMTGNRHSLVSSHFITQNIQKSTNASSVNKPLGSILTRDEKTLINVSNTKFISKAYGHKGRIPSNTCSDMDSPIGTITTVPHQSVVSVGNFITKKESGEYNVGSVDKPYHSMTTSDGAQLTTISKEEREINEAIHIEKLAFFKTYFPEYDPEVMVMLIRDIKMRYLTSKELADITGFKPDTYLGENETVRKKHIGNAVPPIMSEAIILAQWEGYGLQLKENKVA